MTDENNDLNTDQVVTDPDLNSADVVDQQGLADQVADDQLADGTTKDKTVKYEELEKAVQGRKAAEEQAAYAQRQLDLMQQNAQANQQSPVQAIPTDPMEIALKEMGLEPDDLYGENILKVQKRAKQIENVQSQQMHIATSTQQFAASNPDLNEVVGSVNLATGQIVAPSAELLALVAQKPYLANASTPDIYKAMLHERQFIEMTKKTEVSQEFLNRQKADTATQPLAGSAAGGGGSGSQGSQKLLTREQYAENERKIAAGEYN